MISQIIDQRFACIRRLWHDDRTTPNERRLMLDEMATLFDILRALAKPRD